MHGKVFETETTGSVNCYYLSVAEPRKTFRDRIRPLLAGLQKRELKLNNTN